MEKKTVLFAAAFDTKGQECLYVRDLLIQKDFEVVTLDVGTGARGELLCTPDHPREEVVKAAGSSMEEVLSLGKSGKEAQIMEIMTRGAIVICQDLLKSRVIHGIISIGGSMGTNMGTTIMRSLPFGLPKVMLSTVASGDTRSYVGTKDIVMIPSIADIVGLNPITKTVLDQAVGAVTGMASTVEARASWKPLVAITTLGGTQQCANVAKRRLEAKGFEVVIFHSTGTGGMAMEELIEQGMIEAVFDLSPNEVVDHLYGGWADAGPARLETAGRKGKPQLVGPANLDHIVYDSRAKIPKRFKKHYVHIHGPTLFVLRTQTRDMEEIAKCVADKLNKATGPTAVIHSLKGISAQDLFDPGFVDNEANLAYLETLKRDIRPDIEVREVDAHVNDPVFADEAAEMLLRLMRQGKSEGAARAES